VTAPERAEAGAHLRSRTPAGAGPFRDGRPPRGWRLPRRSCRSDPVRASTLPCGRTRDRDRALERPPRRSEDRWPARRRPARPGPVRSEIRGRRASSLRTPEGPGVRLGDGSGRTGPTAPRRSLPPWRVRALRVEQSAVGRGEMRTAEKSVGGRRNTVGGEPGGARAGWRGARGPESAVAITRGRGVTGHGALEAVRGTASSGWVPWSRCGQPGGRGVRQGGGRGEPRVRQGDGSPRARASPVAVG
jgi:hypothetical protein